MNINIYYGGRGLIEDPTIYVMNKLTEVLSELRVNVTRYNLFEQKNSITMMPNTLKDADGVILAVNVEWMGIGGFMQQFLDACWLYGDKQKLKTIYMFPLVIANTYGEKEALSTLTSAWQLLGGISLDGIGAYVENHVDFETSPDYARLIEKKAEALYRVINQKTPQFPSSNYMVVQKMLSTAPIELTPQEGEQLSKYVSDDTYVKKQKEDIEELAQLFKGMLQSDGNNVKTEFINNFRENFKPQGNQINTSVAITMTDVERTLVIDIHGVHLNCTYGSKEDADVTVRTTRDTVNKLVNGRTTFQGAFMSGELTAKGDFQALRRFDQLFQFTILP